MEILKNFRDQRMLVMGDVTLDRYLWGTLTRVSPEASRPHRCQATHRLLAGLGASRLSRSELPRLSCRRSYSDVQIAKGIQ
jgi:bifunctional ADP-heptose synthase (sugar kinase/adenylyltransferase)